MTNLPQEIWKDIVGLEGRYQISNTGLVRTIERRRIHKDGSAGALIESKIKSPRLNGSGYKLMSFRKLGGGGHRVHHLVHRLVAQAFLENPKSLRCVNHIDSNPLNNHYSNLEWCSHYENVQHMKAMGRERKFMRAVVQYSKDGSVEIAGWVSAAHAARGCGISRVGINHCCTGRSRTSGGFHWAYAESVE